MPDGLMGLVSPKRQLPEQNNEKVLLQLDRFTRARMAMQRWAEMAKLCTMFLEGEQWSAADIAKLAEEKRPALTLNKINRLVRLILGYFRQNRTEIQFLAGWDSYSTDDVAECLSNLAKQISAQNDTPWNDANVFMDGITTGRAYWDLRMDFTNNLLGDVKERVLDPFSVYPDPEATDYDPDEWSFWQYGHWMSVEAISLQYGIDMGQLTNAQGIFNSFSLQQTGQAYGQENDVTPDRTFGLEDDDVHTLSSMGLSHVATLTFSDFVNRQRKLIRMLDCQHKVPVKGQWFVDLETGERKIVPDNFDREKIARVVQWCQAQGMHVDVIDGVYKRVRYTVTAGDILIWDDWFPYDSYTLVPFFPYFRRGKTRGFVEDLVDPQREINKRRSSQLHIIMTAANSGWLVPKGGMKNEDIEALKSAGAKPGIVLEYNKDVGAPERIEPSAPPEALMMEEKAATADLHEISGLNEAAVGQLPPGQVQSGRGVLALQQQAVVGADPYFSNFDHSLTLKGRKTLQLIQRYYTEPRIIRSRGDDGTLQQTMINAVDEAGNIVNNVNLGSYQVEVDKRPLAATFKDAQFQEALMLVREGIQVPPEVLLELSSMPRKSWIAKKMAQAQSQPKPPDPRLAAAQERTKQIGMQGQTSLAKIQADAQASQMKVAADERKTAATVQVQREKHQGDMQVKGLELQIETRRAEAEEARAQADMTAKMAQVQSNAQDRQSTRAMKAAEMAQKGHLSWMSEREQRRRDLLNTTSRAATLAHQRAMEMGRQAHERQTQQADHAHQAALQDQQIGADQEIAAADRKADLQKAAARQAAADDEAVGVSDGE